MAVNQKVAKVVSTDNQKVLIMTTKLDEVLLLGQ